MLTNEQTKTLEKLAKKDIILSDENFIGFLDSCFSISYSKSKTTKFTPTVNAYIKRHKVYKSIPSLVTNQNFKAMVRYLEQTLSKVRAADKATERAMR